MRHRAGLIVAIVVTVAGTPAQAHVGSTANGTIASAFPVGAGVTYAGHFGSADDVDYYAFDTTRDGVPVHVTVANTLQSCPGLGYCQIYATLTDAAGGQLGGEGSSAGTGPIGFTGSGYDVDSIDWTLGAAGRYLLVVDSDGDLPTYQFRIDPPDAAISAPSGATTTGSSGSTTGGTTGSTATAGSTGTQTGTTGTGGSPRLTGPLFRFPRPASPQRAGSVSAAVTILSSGVSLRLELLRRIGSRTTTAGRLTRGGLQPGHHTFRVPLNPAARLALGRSGRLVLTLRIRATGRTGASVVAQRPVTVVTDRRQSPIDSPRRRSRSDA
jgi:hypothetical protein